MWNGTHVIFTEKQTEMAWKTRTLIGSNARERERRARLIRKLWMYTRPFVFV
jgi:hypothetical protein